MADINKERQQFLATLETSIADLKLLKATFTGTSPAGARWVVVNSGVYIKFKTGSGLYAADPVASSIFDATWFYNEQHADAVASRCWNGAGNQAQAISLEVAIHELIAQNEQMVAAIRKIINEGASK